MNLKNVVRKLNPFFLDNEFYLLFALEKFLLQIDILMKNKKSLKSREERTHNVVPIEPYDNTSYGYRAEQPKRAETGFGFYLSIAIITFLTIFFFSIYEFAIETWQRLK